MNVDLNVITTNAVVIVPIIIALVQAIKMMPWVKDYYSPLLSIAIGVIISFLSHHDANDLSATVLSGAIYGLIASGLYSGVRTTMKARTRMKQQQENCQYPHNKNKY
jgi:uncharacterized membrane protein (DUF441 family)